MHRSRLELDADGDLICWRYTPDESSDEPDVELVVIGDPYDLGAIEEKLWALAADRAEFDRLEEELRGLVADQGAYSHA